MRRLRRILIIALSSVLGLVLLLLVLAAVFEQQIGQRVIGELNKSLRSELRLDEFDLSLIAHFPSAAVRLKGVALEGVNGGPRLLEARELAFKFDLSSLFGERLRIGAISVDDGAMYVWADKHGHTNYDVLADSGTEEAGTPSGGKEIVFAIEQASLSAIELVYEDEAARQHARLYIEEASLSGDFSASRFDLRSSARLRSDFLETGAGRFFEGKIISYEAAVDVDLAAGRYQFEEVALTLAGNRFDLTGQVAHSGPGATDYDVLFKGRDCTLQSVLALLPKESTAALEGIESEGNFRFDVHVEGRAEGQRGPAIRASLGLEDGRLSADWLASDFKDVSLAAKFDNGAERSARSSVFELSELSGYFGGERLSASLRVDKLDDPIVDLRMGGALPLAALYGLFDPNWISSGSGKVDVENLRIVGRLAEMRDPNLIHRVQAQGSLRFDDATLRLNGEDMRIGEGYLDIKDNLLSISGLELEGAGTAIRFGGRCQNLLPVLLADSLNAQDAHLRFEAHLDAERIDLDQLLALSPLADAAGAADTLVQDSLAKLQNQRREQLIDFLQGNFEARIGSFRYGALRAEQFAGQLVLADGRLRLKGQMAAMDGRFDMDAEAAFGEKPVLNARVEAKDVDVTQFFEQSGNFGQDVLTSQHLKGRIDAQMAIDAYWDAEGHFLEDQLRVLAGVNLSDGELVGFKMLEDFSSFVKLQDLQHIKFSHLQNHFELRERRLLIPAMFIQSNALNMTLSGEHSFDQDMDYYIKVNAGQTLINKFKRYNPDKEALKARRNGWFNLYFHIFGNLNSSYDYASDKRAAKAHFERSEAARENIRRALAQRFATAMDMAAEPLDWADAAE